MLYVGDNKQSQQWQLHFEQSQVWPYWSFLDFCDLNYKCIISANRMTSDTFGFKKKDVANIDKIIEALRDLVWLQN